VYWRGLLCLLLVLLAMALLGGLSRTLDSGLGVGLLAIGALAGTSALWWFTAWFLLLGEVRARVLIPTGVITSIATGLFGASATIWMPEVVTSNESQFGAFGIALALVTWFSGASTCVVVGACAGSALAEDPGRIGSLIRGGESGTLTAGARRPLPPPSGEFSLRDAFQTVEDS
jgi:membrane protein